MGTLLSTRQTDEEIKAAGGDVGDVSTAVTTTAAPTAPPTVVGQPDYFPFPKGPIALDAKTRIPMKLIKREDVSWNSRIYTCVVPNSLTHLPCMMSAPPTPMYCRADRAL